MEPAPELAFPPYRLDLRNGQLWRGSDVLPLRPKTFAVLRYLVEHAGHVVTRAELLHAVWPDTYGAEGLPKECIHELRQVLEDDAAAPRFIETVGRRQGYRWTAPFTTAQSVQSPKFKVPSSNLTPSSLHSVTSSSPLVGRKGELTQLHGCLERALAGQRQVVFVMGELGIGKTALVETFLAQVNEARGWRLEASPPSSQVSSLKPLASSLWIGQGQCIEHYGAGEAYLPVLEALGRLCRAAGGEQIITLLERHAPTWLVQMPAFLEEAEIEALQRKVVGVTRERMLRELAEAVEVLTGVGAVREPPLLVLVLEDLHWSDYSTLDWLAMVARRRETARLLIIGTYRPAEVIVNKHPLKAVKEELHRHGQCEEILLKGLTAAAISQYLAQRFAAPSPVSEGEDQGEGLFDQLARVIHRSTEGNPLFMINVVDELVAQGAITERAEHGPVLARIEDVAVQVPENLRQLIARQVERLSTEEQRVLEVASVAGAEFSAAVVAAGMEATIEQVEDRCEEVMRRGQFLHTLGSEALPDGTITARYGFLHALYQTVLSERVSGARRIRLHRRVGESEERIYGSRAGEIAAELAVHFERGRDYPRAIHYHQQAGEKALQRSANAEAIDHLSKALELLKALPDTSERAQHELRLQVGLSLALAMIKGYAALEVERASARARELCQQMAETPEVCAALFRLYQFYLVRGDLHTARELGEQLLRIAQHVQAPALRSAAHAALAFDLFSLGDFSAAQEHAEQGIALYDPQQQKALGVVSGDDPGAVGLLIRAWTLQVRGYPDQAQVSIQKSVAAAQELSLPFALSGALTAAADLYLLRRASQAAQESAEVVIALSTKEGFPYWVARATALRGWALTEQGQVEAGIAQIRQALAALQTMGVGLWIPRFLGVLAEACGKAGRVSEGLASLSEALEIAHRTGEREYEAELYRVKGQLTLQSKTSLRQVQNKSRARQGTSIASNLQSTIRNPQLEAEAEACFQKAIEIAHQQGAKSLELRAVTSLSRLWQQQGKSHEAREMLAKIYGWFTEGFDTRDLQEAKTLLDELT